MRAPSISIQRSSTSGPARRAESSRISSEATNSSSPGDNFFTAGGFYLVETSPLSFHLWGASAPRFFCTSLSKTDVSRSEPNHCHPERSIGFAKAKVMRSRRNLPTVLALAAQGIRSTLPGPNATKPSSRGFLLPSPQQLLQHPDTFIHVLFLEQKRRQESHHRILSAIEPRAFRQCRIHDRTRRNLQLNTLDEPTS